MTRCCEGYFLPRPVVLLAGTVCLRTITCLGQCNHSRPARLLQLSSPTHVFLLLCGSGNGCRNQLLPLAKQCSASYAT
jgi:hypothetical protein